MIIDGKNIVAQADDVIRVPAGTRHQAEVAGKSGLVAVQVYAVAGPEQRFSLGKRFKYVPLSGVLLVM